MAINDMCERWCGINAGFSSLAFKNHAFALSGFNLKTSEKHLF
jgi:hypothetical protein